MSSRKIHLAAALLVLCVSLLRGQEAGNRSTLPDTPEPKHHSLTVLQSDTAIDRVFPPPSQDARQKFRYYTQQAFRPGIYFADAFYTGLTMANPPGRYPPNWKNGAEGFARNYGDFLGGWAAVQMGKFTTSCLLHEDARYIPSASSSMRKRIEHALVSVVLDRSDLGQPRFAVANFAGAFAGGFVGNAYLPDHYSDLVNGMKRTGYGLWGVGSSNLADEFQPEIKKILRKLHVPFSGD
ncbi:MAG TPA: hypothetical protein VE783_08445 [Candidatus Limnocylindrales bacterium]|jgi:hypothetical protein|nr:hypothetical protein [Candidatus Limnocylindrales bacterium]